MSDPTKEPRQEAGYSYIRYIQMIDDSYFNVYVKYEDMPYQFEVDMIDSYIIHDNSEIEAIGENDFYSITKEVKNKTTLVVEVFNGDNVNMFDYEITPQIIDELMEQFYSGQ